MPRTAVVRPIELTDELTNKIATWNELATKLADIKTQEYALRQQLALLGDPTKLEGTENLGLPNDWRLKVEKTQNYKAINDNGETVALLDAIYKIDQAIPQLLIKWRPDISISIYKQHVIPLLETHPELKPLASAAIEIKPGAPVVELVPPKQ